MMAMIVAVIVTPLSMVDYHQRCNNHPAIPPPADLSSLAGKGGVLESASTGLREEDGPFPPSHPLPSSFSFSSFSSIVVGPFKAMKMTTEEELVVAAVPVAAAPEAASQSLPQSRRRRRGQRHGGGGGRGGRG